MEEMIKLWEEKGVKEAIFTFNCGGDSMNETEIALYDKNGNIVHDQELEDYFDNEVYNEVEFYVNSDGHYLGEYGTVNITLEDDGDGKYFSYSKNSMSEFSESETGSVYISLTNDQEEFLKTYVESFVGNRDDGLIFNYKTDFILKDMKILEELDDKIISECAKHEFDSMVGNDEDGWFGLSSGGDDSDNEGIIIENGELEIFLTKSYTVER